MNKVEEGKYQHFGWTIAKTTDGYCLTSPDLNQQPLYAMTLSSARSRIDAKRRLQAASSLLDALFGSDIEGYLGRPRSV